MTLLGNLLTSQTAKGFFYAVLLWVFAKLLDKVLDRLFDRKIISPAIDALKWRWRALKTRANPIEATFEISYTPRESMSRERAKREIEQVFGLMRDFSRERLSFEGVKWGKESGEIQISHVDTADPYELQINLPGSSNDYINRPDISSSQRHISKFNFEITLKFPFHNIRSVLENLNIIVRFLEKALDERVSGTFSNGQFIIEPLEGNLTLDEWIAEEGFEMSVLLTDHDLARTEVEFFPDRAELRPPYKEIDSETVRYLRLMLLNYYLRKG